MTSVELGVLQQRLQSADTAAAHAAPVSCTYVTPHHQTPVGHIVYALQRRGLLLRMSGRSVVCLSVSCWSRPSAVQKFDISDCHSLLTFQNTAKTVYFKTCSKCPFQAYTQARSLFTKLNMALLTEFCGRSFHIVCKTFFSSSMVLAWVEMSCIVQA